MLDSGQGEHPAGVDGQHAQRPAQVGTSGHAGLKIWISFSEMFLKFLFGSFWFNT